MSVSVTCGGGSNPSFSSVVIRGKSIAFAMAMTFNSTYGFFNCRSAVGMTKDVSSRDHRSYLSNSLGMRVFALESS